LCIGLLGLALLFSQLVFELLHICCCRLTNLFEFLLKLNNPQLCGRRVLQKVDSTLSTTAPTQQLVSYYSEIRGQKKKHKKEARVGSDCPQYSYAGCTRSLISWINRRQNDLATEPPATPLFFKSSTKARTSLMSSASHEETPCPILKSTRACGQYASEAPAASR
jgi:hypothetical protein